MIQRYLNFRTSLAVSALGAALMYSVLTWPQWVSRLEAVSNEACRQVLREQGTND